MLHVLRTGLYESRKIRILLSHLSAALKSLVSMAGNAYFVFISPNWKKKVVWCMYKLI